MNTLSAKYLNTISDRICENLKMFPIILVNLTKIDSSYSFGNFLNELDQILNSSTLNDTIYNSPNYQQIPATVIEIDNFFTNIDNINKGYNLLEQQKNTSKSFKKYLEQQQQQQLHLPTSSQSPPRDILINSSYRSSVSSNCKDNDSVDSSENESNYKMKITDKLIEDFNNCKINSIKTNDLNCFNMLWNDLEKLKIFLLHFEDKVNFIKQNETTTHTGFDLETGEILKIIAEVRILYIFLLPRFFKYNRYITKYEIEKNIIMYVSTSIRTVQFHVSDLLSYYHRLYVKSITITVSAHLLF